MVLLMWDHRGPCARQEATIRQQYEQVLTIDPAHQDAYLHLGVLYAKQERTEDAVRSFKMLIEINSRSVLGYYYLHGWEILSACQV